MKITVVTHYACVFSLTLYFLLIISLFAFRYYPGALYWSMKICIPYLITRLLYLLLVESSHINAEFCGPFYLLTVG